MEWMVMYTLDEDPTLKQMTAQADNDFEAVYKVVEKLDTDQRIHIKSVERIGEL